MFLKIRSLKRETEMVYS